MPPLVENMMAGLATTHARSAFIRATEFCEPRDAEIAAWECERLVAGPCGLSPLPDMISFAAAGLPVPAGDAVADDVLAFILTRWWHHKFPGRKPPLWATELRAPKTETEKER